MKIVKMIDELNEYCDKTLGFTHYGDLWEISSYRDGTLFHPDGDIYLKADTFKGIVIKAYKCMLNDKLKKMEKML